MDTMCWPAVVDIEGKITAFRYHLIVRNPALSQDSHNDNCSTCTFCDRIIAATEKLNSSSEKGEKHSDLTHGARFVLTGKRETAVTNVTQLTGEDFHASLPSRANRPSVGYINGRGDLYLVFCHSAGTYAAAGLFEIDCISKVFDPWGAISSANPVRERNSREYFDTRDVGDRKRCLKKLKKKGNTGHPCLSPLNVVTQKHLRLLFENENDVVWIFQIDKGFVSGYLIIGILKTFHCSSHYLIDHEIKQE
ncbi:hypothetical protein CLF_106296 [Clonorchis sinensis]|uniref:Uncharacterized protein n=1 Tax=Clonorchis sinensis TaxID=79923 RepID=G7YPU9_CLOSI|nr:hypothetical protein CLF_106296 [Clonorchis sinensis]